MKPLLAAPAGQEGAGDHLGKPRIGGGGAGLRRRRDGLTAPAANYNVAGKRSGLVTAAGPHWTPDDRATGRRSSRWRAAPVRNHARVSGRPENDLPGRKRGCNATPP
ncbi:hypothetical protein ACPPVO_32510 [Dactylosporangium sp. McL0621]|uniref:hypothetical protein n=1 Tax=Dactylosporangium sp. McL0621 TaxID=3415678 RepID=UPI003CF658D7